MWPHSHPRGIQAPSRPERHSPLPSRRRDRRAPRRPAGGRAPRAPSSSDTAGAPDDRGRCSTNLPPASPARPGKQRPPLASLCPGSGGRRRRASRIRSAGLRRAGGGRRSSSSPPRPGRGRRAQVAAQSGNRIRARPVPRGVLLLLLPPGNLLALLS
uniref:Uncharacterized protein n=1 Tax=Sphaerodactylus townsendi TaxID=933632 RepID=A0ACB8FEL3_9SAUR